MKVEPPASTGLAGGAITPVRSAEDHAAGRCPRRPVETAAEVATVLAGMTDPSSPASTSAAPSGLPPVAVERGSKAPGRDAADDRDDPGLAEWVLPRGRRVGERRQTNEIHAVTHRARVAAAQPRELRGARPCRFAG